MLDRLTHFVEHLQREDHFDDAQHQRDLPQLEEEFHANNAGPSRNLHLSTRPDFMYRASGSPYMWAHSLDTRTANGSHAHQVEEACDATVLAEARIFQEKYEADVQYIFSHVQHH